MNGKAFEILNTSNLSELSRVMVAKTQKRFVSLIDSEVQTFLEGEENHSIKKKKPKVTYSVALVLAFLSAENENRPLEDLPLADLGRLPERLLLSARTKSINENFLNRKLRSLLIL